MLQFDARTVQPAVALTPVPEAWYKVVILKSNIKSTAKGDGGYLELQCNVIEGQYQGRTIYWNLNLFNPSQQAVEIAYKTLSAICHCVGQYQVADQNTPDNVVPMLHNVPLYIWVTIQKGEKGEMNNVRGCKDIHGNDPGKTGQGASMPGQGQGAPPAGFGGGAPQAPTWGAPAGAPAAGGTAPGNWQGQPAAAAPTGQWSTAAPTGPGGQPWQAGTNTPPNAAPAPGQWGAQPGPAPGAAPQGQWGAPQQQPQQQPQGQPQQNAQPWPGQQPTQQAQQAPANPQWQQGAPSGAPWQRT